jgi:NADP-dependent 3-hydroxy acid dehydrogenase YdfG
MMARRLTRLVLPKMVARMRGKASTAAFPPGPEMAVYYATKSYVLSFRRALGYELCSTGVTVTTLCPSPTASEFAEEANMQGGRFVQRPNAGDDGRRGSAPGLCGAQDPASADHYRSPQQDHCHVNTLRADIHIADPVWWRARRRKRGHLGSRLLVPPPVN